MDKETLFFKCPKCGIYGKAGKECEFCGEPVIETEEGRTFDSLFPAIQNISADVFAERISKFHRVESFNNNLAVAVSGDLRGLINRNGELILPLQYKDIVNDYSGYISLKESRGPWTILRVDVWSFCRYYDNSKVSAYRIGEELHKGQVEMFLWKDGRDKFVFDLNTKKRITPERGVMYVKTLLDGYLCIKENEKKGSFNQRTYLYSLVTVEGTIIHSFEDPIQFYPVHFNNPYKDEWDDINAFCFYGDMPGIKTPPFWSSYRKYSFTYKLDNSTSLEKQIKRLKHQYITDYEKDIRRVKRIGDIAKLIIVLVFIVGIVVFLADVLS